MGCCPTKIHSDESMCSTATRSTGMHIGNGRQGQLSNPGELKFHAAVSVTESMSAFALFRNVGSGGQPCDGESCRV